MTSKFNLAAVSAFLALTFVVSSVQAGPYIQNGGFELTTPITPGATAGQIGVNVNVNNWISGGQNLNYLFAPNTVDTTGSGSTGFKLWGPNNGSANGLPGQSPALGNFVAADGCAFQDPCTLPSTISQQLANLMPNQSYKVGFLYGFAQQYAYPVANITQYWEVCLASNCQFTASYLLTNHGFSGWLPENFIFTAQTANDVLLFKAFGNVPMPPFALLDGVTVSAVAEPATLLILGVGLLGLMVVGLRRRMEAC